MSEETAAPRSWAIIEALSPETVYEMRVVVRSAAAAVESASFIQRVRIGLKRGNHACFCLSRIEKNSWKLIIVQWHMSARVQGRQF